MSWATIEIGWLSGWAKSTIWTLPTPDAEILLLTTADTACSDVIGKANKALSEVGDSEHSPFGFGAVSYLKKKSKTQCENYTILLLFSRI